MSCFYFIFYPYWYLFKLLFHFSFYNKSLPFYFLESCKYYKHIVVESYVNDIYVLKKYIDKHLHVDWTKSIMNTFEKWIVKYCILWCHISQNNIQLVINIINLLCFNCCTLTKPCLSCLCIYHYIRCML